MRIPYLYRRSGRFTTTASQAQSGQALIELAFVVPMLLLLALGVIEIGRYAYIAILVGNAARAGAAYGAQSTAQTGNAEITKAADNDFAGNKSGSTNNGFASTAITITSSTACGCDSGGTITGAVCSGTLTAGTCATGHWVVVVSVTASGKFNALFNYPGIPTPITITRTASMRVAT